MAACKFKAMMQNLGYQSSCYPTCPKPGTSKTGFRQVKIMKEFVWINRKFF